MKKKTWKREMAAAVLVFLGWTVAQGDVKMVEALVWPSFAFAALAFGLDWHGKKDAQTTFESNNNYRGDSDLGGRGPVPFGDGEAGDSEPNRGSEGFHRHPEETQ